MAAWGCDGLEAASGMVHTLIQHGMVDDHVAGGTARAKRGGAVQDLATLVRLSTMVKFRIRGTLTFRAARSCA